MNRTALVAGVALLLVATAAPLQAEVGVRFFFAGDGRLVLRHGHFSTEMNVRYRHRDGTYDAAALAQIEHFFRSREDGRTAPISLRLVELLAYVQSHYRPRRMVLLSGYRSPKFNENLRSAGRAAAQMSLHTEGMAADVMFAGLDMGLLWRQLRELGGGVGYYRRNKFLHIDTGPARFWEATTSRVQENLSADNARVFVRTDFDRYARLQGGICTLHSVTAFPVLVSARALLVGPDGSRGLTLQPTSGAAPTPDGCFAVEAPPQTHAFRVTAVDPALLNTTTAAAAHIVISTCEPRLGKTAVELQSNRITLSGE